MTRRGGRRGGQTPRPGGTIGRIVESITWSRGMGVLGGIAARPPGFRDAPSVPGGPGVPARNRPHAFPPGDM